MNSNARAVFSRAQFFYNEWVVFKARLITRRLASMLCRHVYFRGTTSNLSNVSQVAIVDAGLKLELRSSNRCDCAATFRSVSRCR
jgi:hypothetical protein